MTLRLLSFLPPSLQDIRDVHDWYEKQNAGLGKEFIKNVIQQIEEFQTGNIIHRFFLQNVRYVQVKKFPYSVFYFLKEGPNQLVIVAVPGNKQDQLSILKDSMES